ncbi:MAG: aspartate kinase [Methanomassiliicoccaceae archaeon]|jgi:aspartate kinase|nr:aspartate kinase [Methanomassiliicoccaceae archaeon]
MITVLKFGGTSVGSAEAIIRSANIIMNGDGGRVAVVSAMSGVTNHLIQFLETDASHTDDTLAPIVKKHMDAANELLSGKLLKGFTTEFNSRMDVLRTLLTDKNARNDPFFNDDISSQGERLSTLLLAHVITSMGREAVALTSEEAGIYAIGTPGLGTADIEKTSAGLMMNVRPLIQRGIIPIITGFYGRNEDGKPLTFGRGGSDYSAAVVTNGLDADRLEIWTDVDGFMSADPRIVPEAIMIDEMNFSEAAELAYFGAKVLHPRTIEPVRMKHIPLMVKNSFKPGSPGTLIHNLRAPKNDMLRSVSMKTDLSIITVSSSEIAYRPRMVARIIEKIADAGVILYAISTSLSTVAFLIHTLDVKETLKHLNLLAPEDMVERIDVKSNMALISAVGDNLLERCGVSAEIFGAVNEAEANVEMISEGASDVSLNFVVPTDKAVAVVRSLHKKFVGGRG